MSAHNMTGPAVEDSYGIPLTTVGCTCGGWTRRWHEDYVPPLSEMESDHEAHMHDAGARELMTGATRLPKTPTPTLDGLVAIATALADMAKQSVGAMEAMQEFVDAHAKAKDAGHGVLVVRKADGTITSTANVFLPAGTAVFMEAPGTMNLPLPIRATVGVIPRPVAEYLPRYTIATGETVTLPAAPRPILVTDVA